MKNVSGELGMWAKYNNKRWTDDIKRISTNLVKTSKLETLGGDLCSAVDKKGLIDMMMMMKIK